MPEPCLPLVGPFCTSAVRRLYDQGHEQSPGHGQGAPSLDAHREAMTVTFLAWIAVALRVALSGVRLINPRRRPALEPVRPSTPRAVEARPDADAWHPRVSSGCGR
jgi:hypothetical protein